MNNKKRDNKSRLWWFLYMLLRYVYPNTVEKPFISERHLLYMLFVLIVYLFFLYATAQWILLTLRKAVKDLRAMLYLIYYPYYNKIELLTIYLLASITSYYHPHIFTSAAIYGWIKYFIQLLLDGLYFISGFN